MLSHAVEKHMQANPIAVPEPLLPTPDMVADAVQKHMALNPIAAPAAIEPTPEQIASAVWDYVKANPIAAPDPLAPTPEQIGEAVAGYIKANPVELPEPVSPTAEQVEIAVQKHLQANPVPVPEPVAPTAEQIAMAVQKHLEANPVHLPEPLAPTDDQISMAVKKHMADNPVAAPEPMAPSAAQVEQAVASYIKANPPQDGQRGLDALEINILPRIESGRGYARGTYACHNGGILKAISETVPGDDPLKCGWQVVIDGVKATEVHPISEGVVAIKTVLTSGGSSIAKVEFPVMSYQGTWKISHGEYSKGHMATHQGSLWHCNRQTADRPGTSDAWTLAVKKGADFTAQKTRAPASDVYRLDQK
jgi:hypothetical protein